jgi:hypothetical protein
VPQGRICVGDGRAEPAIWDTRIGGPFLHTVGNLTTQASQLRQRVPLKASPGTDAARGGILRASASAWRHLCTRL